MLQLISSFVLRFAPPYAMLRPMLLPRALLFALPVLMAGCSTVPCPICYQDAWSREPFPGEAKQHLPTPTPAEIDRARAEAESAPTAEPPQFQPF